MGFRGLLPVVILGSSYGLTLLFKEQALLYMDDFSNSDSGWSRKSTEKTELFYENGEYHIQG